jgi:segregation and condensation protein B
MTLYPQEIKELLEALLLCSAEPLTLASLCEITGYPSEDILETLDQLQQDYHQQGRGFEICEIAGGWMFATFPMHAPYIERLVKPRLSSLSQASLEVLSIIAYRQPVTRGEMEEIRGVNCDSSINTLLERGLIREAGRKEVAGRPIMFATTTDFLKYFGLASLRDLPALDTEGPEDSREGNEPADGWGREEPLGSQEAEVPAANRAERELLDGWDGEDHG